MSNFRTRSERFTRVELLEKNYEGVLRDFAPQLFPMWHMARWSPLVEGLAGRARPDEILVKDDFSDWLVVEVELAHHPESHFQAQLNALAEASYSTDSAIKSALRALDSWGDEKTLTRMMTEVQPGLLCIVDSDSQVLEQICRESGFLLAVITPLRSDKGTWAVQEVRIPPILKTQTAGLSEFDLPVVNEIGTHVFCELPRMFPQGNEFFVRVADVIHIFPQLTHPSSRQTMIPKEVVKKQKSLRLKLIDADRALFELID